jgi:hypothetical protein
VNKIKAKVLEVALERGLNFIQNSSQFMREIDKLEKEIKMGKKAVKETPVVKKSNKKEVVPVKKAVKVVEHKPEVIERKHINKNVTKKPPYEDMKPGSFEWIECWKKFPGLQKGMIKYAEEIKSTLTKKERIQMKKRNEVPVETKLEQKKRDEERKKIEAFVRENGVAKRRGGKGQEIEDDDDDFEDEEEVVVPVKKTVKKAVKETPVVKKSNKKEVVPVKKAVKVVEEVKSNKKIVKSKKEEVIMKTIGRPFGADGETFDLYAEEVPTEIKTISQLKKWLIDNRRNILEYKKGKLKAYQPERVTNTGRVAKVTVKKCGSKNAVTYRSNRNSKVVE